MSFFVMPYPKSRTSLKHDILKQTNTEITDNAFQWAWVDMANVMLHLHHLITMKNLRTVWIKPKWVSTNPGIVRKWNLSPPLVLSPLPLLGIPPSSKLFYPPFFAAFFIESIFFSRSFLESQFFICFTHKFANLHLNVKRIVVIG